VNFLKVAKQIIKSLKDGDNNNLQIVIIKGKGVGFYYDLTSNKFIPVQKHSEMYFLPIEKDENGNYYIFLPYAFSQGAVILVPEEELTFIGYNWGYYDWRYN